MKKTANKSGSENPKLDPSQRICPIFDETGIAMFPVADRDEMGVRVLDNCAEDHIM